jgi:hypothetical protein
MDYSKVERRKTRKSEAAETASLLDSAINRDQMIVLQTELLGQSLGRASEFLGELDRIKSQAIENAEMLRKVWALSKTYKKMPSVTAKSAAKSA